MTENLTKISNRPHMQIGEEVLLISPQVLQAALMATRDTLLENKNLDPNTGTLDYWDHVHDPETDEVYDLNVYYGMYVISAALYSTTKDEQGRYSTNMGSFMTIFNLKVDVPKYLECDRCGEPVQEDEANYNHMSHTPYCTHCFVYFTKTDEEE